VKEKPPHLHLVGQEEPPPEDFNLEGTWVEVPDFFVLSHEGKPIGSVGVLLDFDGVPPDLHARALALVLAQKRILDLGKRPSFPQRILSWFSKK
jgi:hypothetical protein